MSGVTDFLFGGDDTSAQDISQANIARARSDVLGLQPRVEQGYALAQQALTNMLPQYERAILGQPVDYGNIFPSPISTTEGGTSLSPVQQRDLNSLLAGLTGQESIIDVANQIGDIANIPDIGINAAGLSSGQKSDAIQALQALSLFAPVPLSLPMMFTRSMFKSDLEDQMVDPSNPEGAAGSGGTGSGAGAGVGHGGADFGGYGGGDIGGV